MTNYSEELKCWFREHGDRSKAQSMEAYMRNQYSFLGIKAPERSLLLREFWKMNGMPEGEQLLQVVRQLWQQPEREFQNVAMDLLAKHAKNADKTHIDLLEELVMDKSWWDTVDVLAAHLIGQHFALYPELITAYTERWIESDNLWLRRTAILFQLKYKQRTDTGRLFDYINRTKDEKEFFIRKAIGWALREYSKTDEEAVIDFVAETKLSPLSEREALKRIHNK
ncbi:MAG: DNA alkylation repair protein [Candidatus Pristimantibacillus sp.]